MAQFGAVVRPGGALEEGLGPETLRRALEEPGVRGWLDLEASSSEEIGALESYLSQVNNRLSEVMKTLTALATVGLPFTIVSGFFGMNFEGLPWTKQPWGVPAAGGVMAVMAAGLFLLFPWRRWL